ncbi:hypothetical protein ACH415_20115 [Streptomyces californicus]|uniref:hypothetical protein n=1 Tax=Streptomyces californicus TaxID=67351 RepID=UPI0037B9F915
METMPDFAGLYRIPDGELPLRDIRYLALVRVDLIALYRRWGRPDVVLDSLAEWLCFAFALPGGGVFAFQREAYNPPTPGFLLVRIRCSSPPMRRSGWSKRWTSRRRS